jgi:hypothetical protein
MSFNDLMSSGKGPGVIGMLLGLLVLVGFGSLAIFVFDDDSQTGVESLQGTLKRQTKELQHLQSVLADREAELALTPVRAAAAEQLKDLKLSIQAGSSRIQWLEDTIPILREAVETGIPQQRSQYLDQYRGDVRSRAVGVKLDELETRSGRKFEQVEIKQITAKELIMRHSDGSKPIPCEELPADLYDYFQFNDQEIANANAREAESSKKRAEAQSFQDKRDRLQMTQQQLEECQRRLPELRALEKSLQSQISQLRREENQLEGGWNREKNKPGLRNPEKFKTALDQTRQQLVDADAALARTKDESQRRRDEERELKNLVKSLERELEEIERARLEEQNQAEDNPR